jgi:TetR/AcrR family transcriptional repressor of nem operon
MKVSRDQMAENRARILLAAGRLFREKGFEGIGVADIMQAAGLTHGGFYGHFKSKDDLAAEACAHTLTRKVAFWPRLPEKMPKGPLAAIAESYLTTTHRDNPGKGCVLASLGGDTARQPAPVRQAFAEGLGTYIEKLTEFTPGRTRALRRQRALAAMSGFVGAMILARAVDDPGFSEEILKAGARTFGQAV